MAGARLYVAAVTSLLVLLGVACLLVIVLSTHVISLSDRIFARRSGQAAVLFSGDAGFLGDGIKVARVVEGVGLPVYGVSSLAEFKTRRSVPETTHIVEVAVRAAMRRYGAGRILLVGHSFGADVVAVALPQLAPDVERALIGVALVVPSKAVYLKADPTELSYRGRPDAELGSVWRITSLPIVCIRGQAETDSACPPRTVKNIAVIVLPGGHALHHDMPRLSAALRHGLALTGGTVRK